MREIINAPYRPIIFLAKQCKHARLTFGKARSTSSPSRAQSKAAKRNKEKMMD